MRNEDRKLLTLEERLELAAKSQAASPESAACMVRRLSVLHTEIGRASCRERV